MVRMITVTRNYRSVLKEELERRGEHVFDSLYAQGLLRDLYEKRRNGQDFAYELDEIIYQALGRVS